MAINFNFKNLNILLIAGIILAVIIGNIPENIYLKISQVIDEYKEVQSTYETMTINFKMKDYYEERKIQLVNEVKSLDYETQIYLEQIIDLISYQCVNNGIEIQNISFDNIELFNSEDIEQLSKQGNNTEAKNSMSVLHATAEFNCGLDNILDLIDDLKIESRNIALSNIRVLRVDDKLVNVSADMNFYYINSVK